MIDIILKKAQCTDVPILLEMLQQMAADLNKRSDFNGSVSAIEAAGFSEHPIFEVIIAWRDSKAIGFILYFYEFSTWRGETGIYVQDLFVDTSARGLGMAKRLTKAAAEQGHKERDAHYIRLAVHDDNDIGFGFYQAMGFQAVGDETTLILKSAAFSKLIDR